MKTFDTSGDKLNDFIAVADLVSGDIVKVGSSPMVGVAEKDILTGAIGTLLIRGTVLVPLDAATAVAQGAPVDWDATAKDVVADAAGDFNVGISLDTKSAAAGQFVRIRLLNP